LEQVTSTYSQDPAALNLLTKLLIASDSVPNFTLTNGLLRYKNKVWLGCNKPMQQQVMHALHSSPLGGHSGVPVTYKKIKQLFYWVGMKADIHSFVQSCSICQQAKPDRAKYPGLL
jgi:hypothetical protein